MGNHVHMTSLLVFGLRKRSQEAGWIMGKLQALVPQNISELFSLKYIFFPLMNNRIFDVAVCTASIIQAVMYSFYREGDIECASVHFTNTNVVRTIWKIEQFQFIINMSSGVKFHQVDRAALRKQERDLSHMVQGLTFLSLFSEARYLKVKQSSG